MSVWTFIVIVLVAVALASLVVMGVLLIWSRREARNYWDE